MIQHKLTIILSFCIICLNGLTQETKYYHTFKTSDSDIRLTEWRVAFELKGEKYIIETVDIQNRVKELRLIDNGELYKSDCYDISLIKYEYKEDSIIQYNMENDTVYSVGVECGYASKIIYILEKQFIKRSIKFNFYDQILNGKNNLDPEFRLFLEEEKVKNENGIESNYNFIWGYQFSSTKYIDYLPVKENPSFENYDFQYTESSKESPFAIPNSRFLYLKNEK